MWGVKRRTKKSIVSSSLLIGLIIIYFLMGISTLYERPIVELVDIKHVEEIVVNADNSDVAVDVIYDVTFKARLENTKHRGETLTMQYTYSDSAPYHSAFDVGDKVFVTLREGSILTAEVIEVKRDQEVLILFSLFLLIMLVVGQRQGLFAVLSLIFHVSIMAGAIYLFIARPGTSLLLLMGIAAIFMTVVSLIFVSGLTKKTLSAILSTLTGLALMMTITLLVLRLTNQQGLRFEEMGLLTRHPDAVFTAGLLIGAIGAVMDVAVTIGSTLFQIKEEHPMINTKSLVASGRRIGQDIMGTMTTIVFFAYISGTIPTLLIYLLNDASLGYSLSMNFSLELVRALSSGIGIVLTIPVSILFAVLLTKVGEAT
ncbi:hypothetical protein GCM10012290_05280 [Halolactibacillus alkaliphilus]|uniref:YibE/F family protein n=1 Tax=Halolactibacillus alkaliphilus TaxID=442899 RepID=A0A511WYV6_9BACI|nr:YibE/F family protein [Halolactibacillus alkaliphilus]GEN55838.1 hypothetical protein HAL01_03020 [Halolactibacillus alkaliphilus]GGN65997.1 hypothetical protein GCM10012290_05280 [Halolactibacillus alkaliphilus]SFO66571.1 Uncharacterized membrane protein [Halolactibacillus alkaliphilus]